MLILLVPQVLLVSEKVPLSGKKANKHADAVRKVQHRLLRHPNLYAVSVSCSSSGMMRQVRHPSVRLDLHMVMYGRM